MPQEAWLGRDPWPVPAPPTLVPKQGPRSSVTRSLQIQVIYPSSISPNPPRSCTRRSQAPTRKGLRALEHQRRRLQDRVWGERWRWPGAAGSFSVVSNSGVPQNLIHRGLREGRAPQPRGVEVGASSPACWAGRAARLRSGPVCPSKCGTGQPGAATQRLCRVTSEISKTWARGRVRKPQSLSTHVANPY